MPRNLLTFTPSGAGRFRRAFRSACDHFRVTSAMLGEAVDLHCEWPRKAAFGGHKWVNNVMMTSSPLAHAVARRLVAILFLARDGSGSFAIADDKVAHAELQEFLWLLRRLGALPIDPELAIPVFIAPEHIAQLAGELAGAATSVPGITHRQRGAITNSIASYLRERTGAMNRFWRCAFLDRGILDEAKLSEAAAREVLEELSRAVFRDAFVAENELPSWGPDLQALFRERDKLMGFAFPPILRPNRKRGIS